MELRILIRKATLALEKGHAHVGAADAEPIFALAYGESDADRKKWPGQAVLDSGRRGQYHAQHVQKALADFEGKAARNLSTIKGDQIKPDTTRVLNRLPVEEMDEKQMVAELVNAGYTRVQGKKLDTSHWLKIELQDLVYTLRTGRLPSPDELAAKPEETDGDDKEAVMITGDDLQTHEGLGEKKEDGEADREAETEENAETAEETSDDGDAADGGDELPTTDNPTIGPETNVRDLVDHISQGTIDALITNDVQSLGQLQGMMAQGKDFESLEGIGAKRAGEIKDALIGLA